MKTVPGKESSATTIGDPYQEFLEEQRKREAEWSANRQASAAKKARLDSGAEAKAADEVSAIKKQLESKKQECVLLRSQLLGQETLCKVRQKNSVTLLGNGLLQFEINSIRWFYENIASLVDIFHTFVIKTKL